MIIIACYIPTIMHKNKVYIDSLPLVYEFLTGIYQYIPLILQNENCCLLREVIDSYCGNIILIAFLLFMANKYALIGVAM